MHSSTILYPASSRKPLTDLCFPLELAVRVVSFFEDEDCCREPSPSFGFFGLIGVAAVGRIAAGWVCGAVLK